MNLPRFGVLKPVPINILMIAFLIGGVFSALTITREFFPESRPNRATVTLPYPGATPEEVEQGLAIKVEDRLSELDDVVEEIRTNLAEGGGGVVVKFRGGVRLDRGLDKIQRSIDALRDLPAEAERIRVAELEPKLPVIMVSLFGDAGEDTLKEAIREVRDDLRTLPGMGEILTWGARDYEVRVDVSYESLLKYGLSLPEVAQTIRAWMVEVPGGTVRTPTGNISVRTMGVEERATAISEIVLRSDPAGAALRVGDIASIREGFVDERLIRRFNGRPAVSLVVYKTGDQDAVEMARMVRAYVAGRNGEPLDTTRIEERFGSNRKTAWELGAGRITPPPGGLATHSDLARFIEDRLNLVTRNAFWGAMLVFSVLFLFLNWRVAFWVGVGLVTAMSGTLLVMKVSGVTLNLLTMFGLIVVLGLLVDDAIVVAENIQHRHDAGEPALPAAIGGANQVLWPVVATVITSIVAFLPLRFIEGPIGDMLGALPLVVACALTMSLIESLLLLPSHMGHSLKHRDLADRRTEGRRISGILRTFEQRRDAIINDRIVPAFGDLLNLALRYRYVSTAIAITTLLVSVGMYTSGRVEFTFLASEDSETIVIDIRMPIGTPIDETEQLVGTIEAAAMMQESDGRREVRSVSAIVGETRDIDAGVRDVASTHVAQIFLELEPVERRVRESSVIIDSIRTEIAHAATAADSMRFSEMTGGPGGPDITFEVLGDRIDVIERAVADIQQELQRLPGVFDIGNDNYAGQRELRISVKPAGAALGFSNEQIAMQVRSALFGIDAHVFSERREDIDVRVRLDEPTRRGLYNIENLWVLSPVGVAVPLIEVAEINDASSYAMIRRIDRRRAVTVTADTAADVNPEAALAEFPLEELRARHPGVIIQQGGRQRELSDAFGTLPLGFAAALIAIYVILAWLFSSFTQPIAVMLAIPFGVIGVIWGHFLLGFEITFLSLIGFVALSGIVVNDSLILVEFYNTRRRDGLDVREALVQAGKRRLRPIFLTTITTVCGLLPLMLEQSFQARFLIPMAIAISFGLMSATVLILIVLPCILVIVEDLKNIAYYLWHGRPRPQIRFTDPGDLLASPE